MTTRSSANSAFARTRTKQRRKYYGHTLAGDPIEITRYEHEIGGSYAPICGFKSADKQPCGCHWLGGQYPDDCLGSYCRIVRCEIPVPRVTAITIAGINIYEHDPRWPGEERAERIVKMYRQRGQRGQLDSDEGQEAADKRACRLACLSWPYIRNLRDERAARQEELFNRTYEKARPEPVSLPLLIWTPEDSI